MIAVVDTSPLCYLVLIGEIDLVQTLISGVLVPPGVGAELPTTEHGSTQRLVGRAAALDQDCRSRRYRDGAVDSRHEEIIRSTRRPLEALGQRRPRARPVIPADFITEWRSQAPWVESSQVEQDLVISRALVEIFEDDRLSEALAFRGGTALYREGDGASSKASPPRILIHTSFTLRSHPVHGRPSIVFPPLGPCPPPVGERRCRP